LDIIEEYKLQQSWRNWRQYIAAMPLNENDRVIDLGCSVGGAANILAKQVASVTGIDLNKDFINYCKSHQQPNQSFICNDFTKIDYGSLSPITGIWSSFSISYLSNPAEFLTSLYEVLQPDGWIALVDISCFISGNMLRDSTHYNAVRQFEIESYKSEVYDFDFGAKMEPLLKQIGLNVIYVNNDVTDAELNFNGAAEPQILCNWQVRLERMRGLRNKFPNQYTEICDKIIASLASKEHDKRNNVRFVVAKKL
jgi:ubiquinone/menaquinone biosynthesis C-methylase UbiE